MKTRVRLAESSVDRARAYRFRYDLYCGQQHLFLDEADHAGRTLSDDDDDEAMVWIAEHGDEVIGTLRVNLAGARGFSPELTKTFDLDRFQAVVPAERLAVLSRFLVAPRLRGGVVSGLLMAEAARVGVARRIDVAFCDCEPHLIDLYRRLGFRPYKQLYNHPTSGLLVPLVLLLSDRDHLVRVNSLLLGLLPDDFPRTCEPELRGLLNGDQELRPPDRSVFEALEGAERHGPSSQLASGLDAAELDLLLRRSSVMSVRAGDVPVCAGHTSRTVYVVLAGTFEVVVDDRIVGVLTPGDTFGEIALLLDRARTADIRAVTDGQILALSDRVLTRLVEQQPVLASKLLLNLSRSLARKLVNG